MSVALINKNGGGGEGWTELKPEKEAEIKDKQ